MIQTLKVWIKAIRAPFFAAPLTSGILGAVIAWHNSGDFHWGYFFLTLSGIVLLNAGTNLINDYFDHTSNLDEINKHPTRFSGGSRVIQDQLLSPRAIFYGGILSFASAGTIGLYLNYRTSGNVILIIGLVGLFLGYFYTAHPLRLGYTPLGEIVTGFACGPLIVCGSYYVQAQSLSWEPFWASIPIGILLGLILFINEFQDYEADKAIGKKTLPVILGKRSAIKLYYLFLGGTYLFTCLGVLIKLFPPFVLITLLTLPLAYRACKVAMKHFDRIIELLPANAATIALDLTFGLLFAGGYVLDRLVGNAMNTYFG